MVKWKSLLFSYIHNSENPNGFSAQTTHKLKAIIKTQTYAIKNYSFFNSDGGIHYFM